MRNALLTHLLFLSSLAAITMPSAAQNANRPQQTINAGKPIPKGKAFWQSDLAKDALALTKLLLAHPQQPVTPIATTVTPHDSAYQQGLLVDVADTTSYQTFWPRECLTLPHQYLSVPALIKAAEEQHKTHVILPAILSDKGDTLSGPKAIQVEDLQALQDHITHLGNSDGIKNEVSELFISINPFESNTVHVHQNLNLWYCKDKHDGIDPDFKVIVGPKILAKTNLQRLKAICVHEQGHEFRPALPPNHVPLNHHVRYEMFADQKAMQSPRAADFVDGLIAIEPHVWPDNLSKLHQPSDVGNDFKNSFTHPQTISRIFMCMAYLLVQKQGQQLTANDMWDNFAAIGKTPYDPKEDTYQFGTPLKVLPKAKAK